MLSKSELVEENKRLREALMELYNANIDAEEISGRVTICDQGYWSSAMDQARETLKHINREG